MVKSKQVKFRAGGLNKKQKSDPTLLWLYMQEITCFGIVASASEGTRNHDLTNQSVMVTLSCKEAQPKRYLPQLRLRNHMSVSRIYNSREDNSPPIQTRSA